MGTRRQERRGTLAEWTAANPVLAAGEIGVVMMGALSLTPRFKIGDGVATFTALPFAGGGDTGLRDVGKAWLSGACPNGIMYARRRHITCELTINPRFDAPADWAGEFMSDASPSTGFMSAFISGAVSANATVPFNMIGDDGFLITGATLSGANAFTVEVGSGPTGSTFVTYVTDDPWPTALPGLVPA